MADRPLVLVTRALPTTWLAGLTEACELVVGPDDPPRADDPIWARLDRADGILSLLTERIDAALVERAPRLRVVSNMAVGLDNVDVAACTRRGIAVGHTPGVLTDATADLTMALILAWCRRLIPAAHDAAAGRWHTWSPTGWLGRDLAGARLGIFGLGAIGRAVARRARGFGMDVIACTRRGGDVEIPCVDFATLLATSDVLSIHTPLTPETRGRFDAATLARMREGALLVNTARGPIVDTDALVAALAQGRPAGAAIDVTDPEPLPAEHPLFARPEALVLPHIGSATVGTRRAMAELACANLLAGLRGEPLPHAAR